MLLLELRWNAALLDAFKFLHTLTQYTELFLYPQTFSGRLGALSGNKLHSLIIKIANHLNRKHILQRL